VFTTTTLAIRGYRDEPVPNTFVPHTGGADHLAIVFPGIGYTCDMPLLYYPARMLADRGADVLRVEYAYQRRADYAALAPADQAQWLFADATAACQVALAQRAYRRITLVGKSLGTLAMGHVLTADERLADSGAVWLTPLVKNERVRAQVAQWGGHSLFVIGTADPYYDAASLAEVMAATHGDSVVVEGADHSLEIAGDVEQSLEAMMRVMRAMGSFLAS
jgi:predicted alpha/beta-hydrolase family hydrolase